MMAVIFYAKASAFIVSAVLAMQSPWGDAIDRAYTVTGLDELAYPRTSLLALIEVESCGKTNIKKGKYVGPLQLGPLYLAEANVSEDMAQTRHGAAMAWARVQKRYSVKRAGDSDLAIAVMHKGGPGTLKLWRSKIAKKKRSLTWKEQIEVAGSAARAKGVRGMPAFLERYTAARMGAGWWCGPNNELPDRSTMTVKEML